MRSARWRFVAPDGREFLPYAISRQKAAEYLAWLLDLDVSYVRARLTRVDLLLNAGPGLARASRGEVSRKRRDVG